MKIEPGRIARIKECGKRSLFGIATVSTNQREDANDAKYMGDHDPQQACLPQGQGVHESGGGSEEFKARKTRSQLKEVMESRGVASRNDILSNPKMIKFIKEEWTQSSSEYSRNHPPNA